MGRSDEAGGLQHRLGCAEQDEALARFGTRRGAIEVCPPSSGRNGPGRCRARRRTGGRRPPAHFDVPSMQAILFDKPELRVFGPDPVREATLDHIGRVAELGRRAGRRPWSSARREPRSWQVDRSRGVRQRAIDFFREAGRICAAHEVWLCIEPLPEAYGSNFVTHWRDAADLVRAVDARGFGLHLDTGCIHLAGDDPREALLNCQGMTRHFHVSEPHLADFGAGHRSQERRRGPGEVDYRGWISIEMRRPDDPVRRIGEAVDLVSACYGDR